MRLPASDIAGAAGGTLVGADREVDGAAIDSRTIAPGQLFVPIVADRDGHEFVAAAVEQGAPAYLTSEGAISAVDATAIEVGDTAGALLRAGTFARDQLDGPVVGITGSVGKTTVKDLTAAAVAGLGTVAASERSFNNELGVPLTLLNAPDDTAVAVVEMGARGKGHITLLCGVARPTVAVVTVVALAHTELFGSLEAVAQAKGELVEALPDDGTAVLNNDQAAVAAMAARTRARVLTFGTAGDIRAEHVTLDDDLRAAFHLVTPWGEHDLRLAVHGAHQVGNALAAAGAALACGAGLEDVVERLAAAHTSPWRMQLSRTGAGARILNDAYNANPTSMEAALRGAGRVAGGTARRRARRDGRARFLRRRGTRTHRRARPRAGDPRRRGGDRRLRRRRGPGRGRGVGSRRPARARRRTAGQGQPRRGARDRRRTAGCVTRCVTARRGRCSAGCGGTAGP